MPSNRNGLVLGLFMVIGAVLAAWSSVQALLAVGHALASGASRITWWPLSAAGLPLGVSFAALSILCVVPAPVGPAKGSKVAKAGAARSPWITALLVVTVAGLALAAVAPPLVSSLVGTSLTKRGFMACPALSYERPRHLRWARMAAGDPGTKCPRDWHDAKAE